LQHGEAVELPDGRRVTPDQVLGPPRRGRRVAYVTDTRPCSAAVRLAADGDLLIHEATFEQGWEDEAHSKGHSTVADAAEIAHAAGARCLVLTHISPRYESAGLLRDQARDRFENAHVAEDGTVIELDRDGAVIALTGRRR
jgi:ribonuclease Z